MKINISDRLYFRTILGTFAYAVETEEHVYYVNYTESDENAAVIMFDKSGNVVSDNYFAWQDMLQVLEDESYMVATELILTLFKKFQNQ